MEKKEYVSKEKLLSDLEYEFVCDFIKLRKDNKLSQREMGEKSQTIREMIAKIENHLVSPQLNTLIKLLEPLGYTVKIVKIKKEK